MKQKCALGCALVVLLMCAPSCGPVACAATTMTTEVGVTFMEAESVYFFSFPEGGGMDIHFGERRLPRLGEDLIIRAFDGGHTLRVCDTGAASGQWSVSAEISQFTCGTEAFFGYLHLFSPICTAGFTPVFYANTSFVLVESSARKVAEGPVGRPDGDYDMRFIPGTIELGVAEAEATKIQPLPYRAVVTWTLSLTP